MKLLKIKWPRVPQLHERSLHFTLIYASNHFCLVFVLLVLQQWQQLMMMMMVLLFLLLYSPLHSSVYRCINITAPSFNCVYRLHHIIWMIGYRSLVLFISNMKSTYMLLFCWLAKFQLYNLSAVKFCFFLDIALSALEVSRVCYTKWLDMELELELNWSTGCDQ